MTNREAIELFRKDLREANVDTDFTNQHLYNNLIVQARWLNKREAVSGRLYKNSSLFQILGCLEVIETSTIEKCCPVKTNCKIYRTKDRLPEMWLDDDGPIIKSVMSVDRSTSFTFTSATNWLNKKEDPYKKYSKEKYVFFSDGYLWFPEHNPHLIHVEAFFTKDQSNNNTCDEGDNADCVRFLDQKFMLPDWCEAEMLAKALEKLAGVTKRMPEDTSIDKNTNSKQ